MGGKELTGEKTCFYIAHQKIAAVSLVKRITAAKLIGESLSESFKNLRGYNRVLSEQHLLRGGNVGDNGAFSRSLSRDRFVQML